MLTQPSPPSHVDEQFIVCVGRFDKYFHVSKNSQNIFMYMIKCFKEQRIKFDKRDFT